MDLALKTFFEWLRSQPQLATVLQMLLDLTLFGALVVYLGRSRSQSQVSTEELTQTLVKVLDETRAVGEEFDANLQERRKLIQQVVAKLDQKMHEAEQLCRRLENINKEASSVSAGQFPIPRQSETREILRLAQRGVKPAVIAQQLQKPLGEVELVLSLKRLTADE